MKIRSLETGDLGALLDLYAHLHRHDDQHPGDDVVAGVWQEILTRPGHTIFGGWVGDTLISSCATDDGPPRGPGRRRLAIHQHLADNTTISIKLV